MAETNTAPAETQENKVEKTPGKIVSAGVPQKANFAATTEGFAQPQPENNSNGNSAEQANATAPAAETKEAPTQQQAQPENKIPELSDDQLKEILKGKGIDFEDFDTLKKKVEYTPPAPTLTEEEQKKAQIEEEKKLFALHQKRGGTVEQFAAFKSLLVTDPKELGIQKTILDLQKEGFLPEDAQKIAREMHLQVSDEDLALIEDEEERKLLQKKRDFGLKKQESRGLYTQNTAKSYFDSLKQELQELETEKKKMEQHSAKAVEAIKNFQRKQTITLGERDGAELTPIEFDLAQHEEVLNEVLEIVKDPVKLEKHLYTKEGDLNLDFLIPHLVNSVSREKAAKVAFHTGETKMVEHYESKMSSKPPALGSNGKPEGQKGKLVAAGTPQVFRPSSIKNN